MPLPFTYLLFYVIILSIPAIGAYPQSRWTPIGGFVNLRACQKLPDGRVAIATNAGYLLWSTDDGVSFTHQVLDTESGLNSVSFPLDGMETPMIGYAAADSNRVFKTTDGGVIWSMIEVTGTAGINSMAAPSSDTVYVCGHKGTLARSTDGGQSWAPLAISATSNFLKLYFVCTTHGYVLSDSGAVFETTNSGITWNKIPSPFVNNHPISCFAVSPNGALFAGSTYGYVAVSQNDGESWIPNRIDSHWALAFNFGSFDGEDTLVALQPENNYLYVSTNAGNSWDSIYLGGSQNYNGAWTSGSLTLIGNNGSIWPLNIMDALQSDKAGNVIHYLGIANLWLDTRLRKSQHLHAASNSANYYASSSDGGFSWVTHSFIASTEFIGLSFSDDENGILVQAMQPQATAVSVFSTTDDGNSWTTGTSSNLHGPWPAYTLGSDGTMFLLNDTDIAYSIDNGVHWLLWGSCRADTAAEVYSRYTIGQGLFWGEDTAYLSIYDPAGTLPVHSFARSMDHGQTWGISNLGFNVRSFRFINPTNGFALDASAKGVIWNTTNAGQSWAGPDTIALPDRGLWDLKFNSQGTIGLACGDSGELFETFDTAKTWVPDSVPFFFNLNGRLNLVTFVDDTTLILQGQNGMYRRPFHLNSEHSAVTGPVSDSVQSLRVYPNPAITKLVVENCKGNIAVFDALGRSRECPLYQGALDISDLSPGAYYVTSGGRRARFVKE